MTAIPSAIKFIQVEASQTTQPVGQDQAIAMGASINYCRANVARIGDIVGSLLDEATFQTQRDSTWILADGRDVTGSDYATLTSSTNIPDFRAKYLRMKDHGRGLDPHGDLALGSYEVDQFASHSHAPGITDPGHTHGYNYYAQQSPNTFASGSSSGFNDNAVTSSTVTSGITIAIGETGGNENNPKSIVMNYFIKINKIP